MVSKDLNEVEHDFINFMSLRQNKTEEYVKSVYLETRSQFEFGSPEFKALTLKVYELNKLLYDEETEKDLIDTYKYHELMTAYRFLSYTYEDDGKGGFFKKFKTLLNLLGKGNFRTVCNSLVEKVKISKQSRKFDWTDEPGGYSFQALAKYLVDQAETKISSVVDYGCGPAYTSFEIANLHKKRNLQIPTTYLVDIDCLMKDFDVYRFEKHGFPVETISINEKNLYPSLPKHDLCIASEVMEHIKNPVRAFKNINEGLSSGGVLYGNFEDHSPHMLHVSPDLSKLRGELSRENYSSVSRLTYKKR